MEFLSTLWLPILVAAVLVFVVSSVMHMFLPIHKSDHATLPDEDGLLAAMRERSIPPGSYMFPFGCMEDMKKPEMAEKYARGPVGMMVVMPNGMPQIGKSLVQWFGFTILIGACVAYVAHHALAAGAEYLKVFQITGSVAFLGYGLPALQDSIWKGQRLGVSLKYVLDGLVYALATAGAFAWLWPAAAA
jgi:uncharacterized protein YjeT (DUF2065 family)